MSAKAGVDRQLYITFRSSFWPCKHITAEWQEEKAL
jgi:hypothetical protein